jgi:predicted DCC family thiol-disulfide oxidoreductase YuxK
MDRLYVLYDANCGLCSWAKRWLIRQPTLIELRFIPAGSAVAARLFPELDRTRELPEELVVVSDQGAVYRNGSAWIMCLFALEGYRDWANRLAYPLLRPLARQAFELLSSQRSRVSHWLSLASEVEIAETLSRVNVTGCAMPAITTNARAMATGPAPVKPAVSSCCEGTDANGQDDQTR